MNNMRGRAVEAKFRKMILLRRIPSTDLNLQFFPVFLPITLVKADSVVLYEFTLYRSSFGFKVGIITDLLIT